MRNAFIAVVFLVLVNSTVRGEDDPVQTKLNTALKKYDEAIARYREEVGAYFDKRDDAARKAGNKKLVDQIKTERAAFETADALPANAPLTIRQARTTATKDLEIAYATAAKEFLKAKKDDQADLADKSAACLRQYGVLLPTWGATFPPGNYVVTYTKDFAVYQIRPDKTFTRIKDGKERSEGKFEFKDGKLTLTSAGYVSVWELTDGKFSCQHYFPAKNYPNGKSENAALARQK